MREILTPQPKTIRLKRCVVFRRKVLDQTYYKWRLLYTVDPVAKHPSQPLLLFERVPLTAFFCQYSRVLRVMIYLTNQ